MAVNEDALAYHHPLYDLMLNVPGLAVGLAPVDRLLTWGLKNSLWVFPMATSCCGIEYMAASASRVDIDRMGTIPRASPRQADVMLVAGTITVKMAPRVKRLWDQMPEPKWCIAMGSCAISGDFYRNLYSVVPGIDTFLPVDVYVPGCPPNPEAVMHGLLRLQEKVEAARAGHPVNAEPPPELFGAISPSLPRLTDQNRPPELSEEQVQASLTVVPEGDPGEVPVDLTPPSIPGALPDGVSTELAPLLKDRFGVAEIPADAPPLVPAERHVELAATLKALGYRQLVFVAASHHPAKKDGEAEAFEVAYALRTVGAGSKVASWRVRVPATESVPTLTPTFAGADWQEREQFDLVGVRFSGHPDLRRVMLPENWEGHPLRRDYPADHAAAPWR